jgi:hypothetical protein
MYNFNYEYMTFLYVVHVYMFCMVSPPPPPFFSNFLFTNLFSIKFLYFFIISSLFPYFNLFVSIFIPAYNITRSLGGDFSLVLHTVIQMYQIKSGFIACLSKNVKKCHLSMGNDPGTSCLVSQSFTI